MLLVLPKNMDVARGAATHGQFLKIWFSHRLSVPCVSLNFQPPDQGRCVLGRFLLVEPLEGDEVY